MQKVGVVCTAECGMVEVRGEHLKLYVSASRPDASYYTFTCPKCNADCRREAPAWIIELLRKHEFQPIDLDAEVSPELHDLDRHGEVPLVLDCLIDVMLDVAKWGVLGHEPTYERTGK